jgi:hypothetical protein
MVAGVEVVGLAVVAADEPPRALVMAALLLVLGMFGAELPPLMAAGGPDVPEPAVLL